MGGAEPGAGQGKRVHPCGQQQHGCLGQRVFPWSPCSWAPLAAGNDINTIELRPSDAAALATAGTDTVVRVYDESTGQQVVSLDHGEQYTTGCGHAR